MNYLEDKSKATIPNDFMFTQYKSPISDYLVIETKEARLLSEKDWREIISKKDFKSIPYFDMYRSLE